MPADTSLSSKPARTFVCPHCNASFRRSGHLTRHKRSHTNEKPFRCPHCESAFGRFDILLRHERTIHGTTDSSQLYSKGAKNDAFKNLRASLPQPASFPHLNSQPTNTNSTIIPTPVLPPASAYDPFSFAPHSNGSSSVSIPSPIDLSFTRSLVDADNTLLDPQLLALQPSPHYMLPTTFTTIDRPQLPTEMDQSPESLNPQPSPFTWNNLTFFDELDHILGILNPTDDIQAQLDQLISSVAPSGAAIAWSSAPNVNDFPDVPGVSDPSFRIPDSNEVVHNAVCSATPPNNNIDKKLDETAWKLLVDQVQIAKAEMTGLEGFKLPRVNVINRYVSAYISGLNQHIPFLHLPTLNLNDLEIARLLAICSLGALYCFEKENAKTLHVATMAFLKHTLEGKHANDIGDSTTMCQTMLLGLMFAAWSGDLSLFRRSLTLHGVLANTLRSRLRILSTYAEFFDPNLPWPIWIYLEEFRRTYFVAFCFLIQLEMLLDIPTTMPLSEVNLALPSSEEEWTSSSPNEWEIIHTSPASPPTPTFKEAFESLFSGRMESVRRYSEFGGYVMISGLLSAILSAYRLAITPAVSIDWRKFDVCLDAWQRSWNVDPKSHSTGPSSIFGVMAFNASALYRATCICRVQDSSKVKATVQFFNERVSSEEMIKMLNDESFKRVPEMIRALIPACVSLQVAVKIGMKLVVQTVAFWSVEHVFCNFQVALFLSQWLRSIERDGTAGLNNDEARIVSLLQGLLLKADPNADSRQPTSALLLTVWADQFDRVNAWEITSILAKIFRAVADIIKTETVANGRIDVATEDTKPVKGVDKF